MTATREKMIWMPITLGLANWARSRKTGVRFSNQWLQRHANQDEADTLKDAVDLAGKAGLDVKASLEADQAAAVQAANSAAAEVDRLSKLPQGKTAPPLQGEKSAGDLHAFLSPNLKTLKSGETPSPVYNPQALKAVGDDIAGPVNRARMLVDGNAHSWIVKNVGFLFRPAHLIVQAAPGLTPKLGNLGWKTFGYGIFSGDYDKIESWKNMSKENGNMESKLANFKKDRSVTFDRIVGEIYQYRDAHDQFKLAQSRLDKALKEASTPGRPATLAAQDLTHFYESAAHDRAQARADMILAATLLMDDGFDEKGIDDLLAFDGPDAAVETQVNQVAAAGTTSLYQKIVKQVVPQDQKKFDKEVKSAMGKQKHSNNQKKQAKNDERLAFGKLMIALQTAANEEFKPGNASATEPQPAETKDETDTQAPPFFHMDGPFATPPSVGALVGSEVHTQVHYDAYNNLDSGKGLTHPSITAGNANNGALTLNTGAVKTVQKNYHTAYKAFDEQSQKVAAHEQAFQADIRQATEDSLKAQAADVVHEEAALVNAVAADPGADAALPQEAMALGQEEAQLKAKLRPLELQSKAEKRGAAPEAPAPAPAAAETKPAPPPPSQLQLSLALFDLADATGNMQDQDIVKMAITGTTPQLGKNEFNDGKNFLFNPLELDILPVMWHVLSPALSRHHTHEEVLGLLRRRELLKAEQSMLDIKASFDEAGKERDEAVTVENHAKKAWELAQANWDSQKVDGNGSPAGRLRAQREALEAHRAWKEAEGEKNVAQKTLDHWDGETKAYDAAFTIPSADEAKMTSARREIWQHLKDHWWGNKNPPK